MPPGVIHLRVAGPYRKDISVPQISCRRY